MSVVSILSIDGVLVVSLPAMLDDGSAERLTEEVANRLVAVGAHGALIDVSNARMVDSFMGRVLAGVASTAKLLGAIPIVVGMRPEVALTMVELGMDLHGIPTALTIELGLADIRARAGRRA